jgi:hypothetical protein
MDPLKAQFKRLIEIMGWSQTEAAKRLAKTPSAINHLVNPDHPNKPTQTTLRLLKLIIARERPDLFNTRTFQLKEASPADDLGRLAPRERDLIRRLRDVPRAEQEKIFAVIRTMLDSVSKDRPRETAAARRGARSGPRN